MTFPSVEQESRVPLAVLGAAFLFNVGQGVLRPSMPLYLQRTFAANYRMVTLIPVVFGAGKWMANLPTGYLLGRLGRPLMISGLALIALIDVASVATSQYDLFLGLRALGGVGWAMFATVATTAMVNVPAALRRGRAVSLFLMSETSGLLLGSAAGGWLYQGVGVTSPFLFEAGCMLVAAGVVARWASFTADPIARQGSRDRGLLRAALRTPGVVLMGLTSAVLIAIQTGVLVFLFPLYLVKRAGVGPEVVGFLVSLSVFGRLMALWLGGSVSDRWGRLRVLIPGLIIYAALLGSMSWLADPVALGVASFAIGAAAGFVAAIPTALASDQVDPSLHGVTIGWIRTMSDSGQIVGPLVMGTLADAIDLSAPFLFGAALLGATAWQCGRRTKAMARAAAAGGRDS
jgi:MFS family permease